MARYSLTVSARMILWPRKCACCGEMADSQWRATATRRTGKRVVRTTSHSWDVPCCSQCLSHIQSYRTTRSFANVSVILVLFGLALIAYSWGSESARAVVPLVILFAGALVALLIGMRRGALAKMRSTCASLDAPIEYLGWNGTFHSFVFSNRAYVGEFQAANHTKAMTDVQQVG
jgi:hypothetical protein